MLSIEIKAKSGFYPLPFLFIFRLFSCVYAVIDASGNSPHHIDESLAFAYPEMSGEVGHYPDETILFPMIRFSCRPEFHSTTSYSAMLQ